jgi:hypothetical protein
MQCKQHHACAISKYNNDADCKLEIAPGNDSPSTCRTCCDKRTDYCNLELYQGKRLQIKKYINNISQKHTFIKHKRIVFNLTNESTRFNDVDQ